MEATAKRTVRQARRDRRPLAIVVSVIMLVILAQLFTWWHQMSRPDEVQQPDVMGLEEARKRVNRLLDPPPRPLPPAVDPAVDPSAHDRAARVWEVDERFRQGAAMLHAGRHEEAMVALHRVLELEPELPEARVNMGYALLGLERPAEALSFFQGAADLRSDQTNAYYGMGLAYEALGDLKMAIETMETYLHLEHEESYHTRLAIAAVWEWRLLLNPPKESILGEGEAARPAPVILGEGEARKPAWATPPHKRGTGAAVQQGTEASPQVPGDDEAGTERSRTAQ